MRALATLAWSMAASPEPGLFDVFGAMQRELANRVPLLRGREARSSSTDMLEVLWASNFAGYLQLRSLPPVWDALQRVARALDGSTVSGVSQLPSQSSQPRLSRHDRLALLRQPPNPSAPEVVIELWDSCLASLASVCTRHP